MEIVYLLYNLNKIIIIASLPIFVGIILFHIKFINKYSFKDFILSLEDKTIEKYGESFKYYTQMMEPFQEAFCKY